MILSTNTARWHFVRECIAAIGIACLTVAGAWADDGAKENATSSGKATPVGEVDFDCPGLPEASIEVDLSQGMFKDLFGLGDALIAGAVNGINKTLGLEEDSEEAHATADQWQAAHQVVQLARQVVKGVHVREYDEGLPPIKEIAAHFGRKLKAENWETVVRVRSADELYVVNVLHVEGAIKGVFVIVHDDDSTVLANIVCDLSQENMQKLASAAAATGIKACTEDGSPFSIANLVWQHEGPSELQVMHGDRVEVPAPVGDKAQ